uniref:Protein S100 n=1 Tax=Monopterus albus TaxID=43700 RepID=A0A3Q3JDB1_MONAL
MCSNLQKAMIDLIEVFHSYSGKEGDKYKLSKEELKTLLQNELSGLMAESKDPAVIMTDLDENQDGEVDFQEFVVLVAAVVVACHTFFEDLDKGNVTPCSRS